MRKGNEISGYDKALRAKIDEDRKSDYKINKIKDEMITVELKREERIKNKVAISRNDFQPSTYILTTLNSLIAITKSTLWENYAKIKYFFVCTIIHGY